MIKIYDLQLLKNTLKVKIVQIEDEDGRIGYTVEERIENVESVNKIMLPLRDPVGLE